MKSDRSPLHHEALTIDDLVAKQVIVCVRFSGGQPMNLLDESNYRTLRVIEIRSDSVLVESFWLASRPYELDAREYGLVRNESRGWSSTYCTLSPESKQAIVDAQRAVYTHTASRGAMARQLIPAG